MTVAQVPSNPPCNLNKEEDLAWRIAENKGLIIRDRRQSEEKENVNTFFSEPIGEFRIDSDVIRRMWRYCNPPREVASNIRTHSLPIGIRIEITDHGAMLSPDMKGDPVCRACNQPFNHKLLKAILDFNPNANLFLRDLVLNDFKIFVPWLEIGEVDVHLHDRSKETLIYDSPFKWNVPSIRDWDAELSSIN